MDNGIEEIIIVCTLECSNGNLIIILYFWKIGGQGKGWVIAFSKYMIAFYLLKEFLPTAVSKSKFSRATTFTGKRLAMQHTDAAVNTINLLGFGISWSLDIPYCLTHELQMGMRRRAYHPYRYTLMNSVNDLAMLVVSKVKYP